MSGFDVDQLRSKREIANRVAERFNDIISMSENLESLFPVCCICDTFILGRPNANLVDVETMKDRKEHLSWTNMEDHRRTEEIEKFYSFQMTRQQSSDVVMQHNMSCLEGMTLSPRGSWQCGSMSNCHSGFTVCP